MKIYHKYFLYKNKIVRPYVDSLLGILKVLSYVFSLLFILGVVYDHGFQLTKIDLERVNLLYKATWWVFFLNIALHLLLQYKDSRQQYRNLGWIINGLFFLTLIPVVFHRPDEEGAVLMFWELVRSKMYHEIILLTMSFLTLSLGLIRLLGRRTNPSLILAASFFIIILIGTGLLLLPRCTIDSITLSWVDALFTSTSAVCVTGLVPVDISTTFTPIGQFIIIVLIQIGGLGVMTLTSFFAMFFMGNTSLYNQLVVRDMVSSRSLNSLLSTLLQILGFTLVIEGAGMIFIWWSIHGTLNMNIEQELAFSAFHSISAFCNAGFSTLPNNLGNPMVMGNNPLYLIISLLIILGGIGFPILVNLHEIVRYYLQRIHRYISTRHRTHRKTPHLYALNTKIVLTTTLALLLLGTLSILCLEWNNSFASLPIGDKITHAFFNATCPRTAGFNSLDLTKFTIQSVLIYIFLMWVGGAAQSTAGGVKVNAFAVVVLNLWAVLRGSERVEVFGRELSYDSIRRSNATAAISLAILLMAVYTLTLWEPNKSIVALTFECVSALSTVGSSLNVTPYLCEHSKLLICLLMYIGRVGFITLMIGVIKQKTNFKYRYPKDDIIIN